MVLRGLRLIRIIKYIILEKRELSLIAIEIYPIISFGIDDIIIK